jgi:Family of unknown function (DUF5681)
MNAETTGRKQKGGSFPPGKSGNPAGRPKGALNRSTVAAMTLLEGEAEALTRKAVDLALAGDTVALRLCLERLVAPVKDRPIQSGSVTLPPVEPGNVARAVAVVVEAVAAGSLTPSEGQALAGLLDAHRKAIETDDFERRLAELEERAATEKKARHD